MIRLHEETLTDPIDVALLRTSIGAWLEAGRRLDITAAGARSSRDDVRREAVRLTGGVHPRPGATYRLTEVSTVEADGGPRQQIDETDIEVLADAPELVQVQVRKVGSSEAVAVTLEPAAMPVTCTIDLMGAIEASIAIDLEHLAGSRDPQIDITLLHRWAAVEATVTVAVDASGPADRWRWTVRAEGRGRSVVRPIASLAWVFSRRRARAEIDRFLDEAVTDSVTALNAILAEQTADGATSETGARRTVDAWVEQLPADLPRPS